MQKASISSIRRQIEKMQSESESAEKKIRSALNGLDFEVASKQNIRNCLNTLITSANRQGGLSEQYKTAFLNVTNSVVESDGKFGNQSQSICDRIKKYVEGAASDAKKFFFKNKIAKYAALAGLFLISPVTAIAVADIELLKNKGKDIKETYGNAVKVGKECVSWIKQNYENRGITYTITQYTKAFGKVAAGAAMLAATVATGGFMAGLTGVYGVDSLLSGLVDIGKITYNISEGKTAEIEETELLKDGSKFIIGGFGGAVGEALGNAELGEKIGEKIASVVYDGGKIVSSIYTISTGWDHIKQVDDFNLSGIAGEAKTAVKNYYDLLTKVEFNSLNPVKLIGDVKYQAALIGHQIPNITNAVGNLSLIGDLAGNVIAKPTSVIKNIISGKDIEIGGVIGEIKDSIEDNFGDYIEQLYKDLFERKGSGGAW